MKKNHKKSVQTAPKNKEKNGFGAFLAAKGKLIRIVAVVLLIALVALIFLLPHANKGVKPSEEYETANKIMHKHVKENLTKDWFTLLRTESIVPQKLVYVDKDNNTVVIGNKKITYETLKEDHDIIKAKDENSIDELNTVIEKTFKVKEDNDDLAAIAEQIGALPEYVGKIAEKKGIDRRDRILSLIYNTVVGDSAWHIAVGLNKDKMEIVRDKNLKLGVINVNQFYTTMQSISEGKANTTGKDLLQILVQEGALDTSAALNVAYYDIRHDCVRGPKGIICKQAGDANLFQRITKTMKANPEKTYVYVDKGDSLAVLNDTYLCNATTMYGKVDIKALKAATIKEPHPGAINGLMLVIGLIIGLVSYPLLKKSKKQSSNTTEPPAKETITVVPEDGSEPLTIDTVIAKYKTTAAYQEIKGKADKCDQMEASATKYKEIASKYKVTVDKFEALRNCKSETELVDLLDRYGMKKPQTFQQIKDKDYDLEDVVKMYDSQTKHNLIKELREIEEKAEWYDNNKTIVISSIDAFRNAIAGGMRDRAFFFDAAMNKLAIPLLGEGYKNSIVSMLEEDKLMAQEAKAYRVLIGTRNNFTTDAMISDLTKVVGTENARWIASVREGARRYSSIKSFSDTMWTKFIKEFIDNEPRLKDSTSTKDKGWYFGMLMNIAYHTADHIRSIKEDGNAILCYNQKLMANGFNMSTAKEFATGNINKSTEHTNTIYQWATDAGVQHLEIVVDNYAILP